MAVLNDEIDKLYQAPLGSFTADRDALARRSGSDGAMIRRLQKPNAAAWAVNQLFWNRKKLFDRLTTASSRLRTAHERRLTGKDSDIALAEAAHRAALNAAVDEARSLLAASGDAASSATLNAVDETLQTLVWTPLDGRLVKPLKPSGLEAIAALMSGPKRDIRPAAEVVPFRPTVEEKAKAAKREAEEQRRKAATVDRDLRAARAAEEKAEAALERATEALDQATREQTRLEAALEKATTLTRERRDEAQRTRERAKAATAERTRIEGHRKMLEE